MSVLSAGVLLLVTLTISLIVTRVAATALMLTGISPAMARFQARSAYFGVGYTTHEAEAIVNHPVRRRIIMILMLLGNIQIAATMATATVTVLNLQSSASTGLALLELLGGLALLWFLATSRWVERRLNRVIRWALHRFVHLDVRDYVAILQLERGFVVSELLVHPTDWLANQTLRQLRLPDEGVMVLGIEREGIGYIGTPTADTEVRGGDKLILYGPVRRVRELDDRRRDEHGQRERAHAVKAHNELIVELEASLKQSPQQPPESPPPPPA